MERHRDAEVGRITMAGKVATEPVLETIIVRTSELIADNCVEVKGRLGSKIPREYTVHFDRRHQIQNGYQHVPEMGYLRPEQIPVAVKTAALETYRKTNK